MLRGVAVAMLVLAFAAPAEAGWHQPEPTLNVGNGAAFRTSITTVAGTPTLGTFEDPAMRVFQLRGEDWTQLGDTPGGTGESIADVDGDVWAASVTGTQLRVSRWDGSAWKAVGGVLNVDPAQEVTGSVITAAGKTAYIAWTEREAGAGDPSAVHVARWTGAAWEPLGGALDRQADSNAGFPEIAVHDGQPVVVWRERNAVTTNNFHVYVSRWDGGAWVPLGDALNPLFTDQIDYSAVTSSGGALYAAYYHPAGLDQDTLHVLRFDGSAWAEATLLSPSAGLTSTYTVALADLSGAPAVAWCDGAQVHVARLNGAAWQALPTVGATDQQAFWTDLTSAAGTPYVSWSQDESGKSRQAHAARLQPEFSALRTGAVTATTAAVTADVTTFGVPLPVLAQYGPNDDVREATEPRQVTDAPATFALTGLAPSTRYTWRPAGVDAGVGPTGTFTTGAPRVPVTTRPPTTPGPAAPAAAFRASAVRGTVRSRRPGDARSTALGGLPTGLPSGTQIDARRGTALLAFDAAGGKQWLGTFSRGRLTVRRKGTGRVRLRLRSARLVADADGRFTLTTNRHTVKWSRAKVVVKGRGVRVRSGRARVRLR